MSGSPLIPMESLAKRSWLEHVAGLGALIAIILFAFRNSVLAAMHVWWVSPTYSHCFLIVPISLWLVWERRRDLAHLDAAVEPRALWALPPLLLMWWLGEISTINEVRQFAVIAIVQIAILIALGTAVYRVIWFPVLYLFFLVPTGEYLIGPMQSFATSFTDASLNLLGVPHYTEGSVIELTNGRFQIAEACAGLRFLIATVALGVLFAYMMFHKWQKIVGFLLACVIVPLIGNGLRCVGIILLAHFTNNEYGAGADHLIYGWGFNVAILFVLIFLGSLIRDTPPDRKETAPRIQKRDTRARTLSVLAAAAVLVLVGPAVALWHDSRAISPDIASLNKPLVPKGWNARPSTDVWRPDFPGIDAELAVSLAMPSFEQSPPVDLFVGYYARGRTDHSLTSHVNTFWNDKTWIVLSSGSTVARLGSGTRSMQEWIISSPVEKRMVWSTYWVDGRFTDSLLHVKLLQAQAALGGHEGEAVVAVSTPINGTDDEARARLTSALAAVAQLPGRLNAANRRPDDFGTGN